MPEPREIAIAALQKMVLEVGEDHEFPGDAIWKYADDDVPPARKPPVFRTLVESGYIEATGRTANAVTPDRRSAPTTEYRFGRKLRTQERRAELDLARIAVDFSDACNSIMCVDRSVCIRLCASLIAKRFVILSGLSGSGKTKIAQALARWLAPAAFAADPFAPGAEIVSERKTYFVHDSDRLAVEFSNSREGGLASTVTLPRDLIQEWADYISANNLSRDVPARTIREAVKSASKFGDQLHSFETHLKAAAFALAQWRAEPHGAQAYSVVAVGADWTGNEHVLGYPNGLDPNLYVIKPALELILRAQASPRVPHFLILDEMNLSHVERYFADLLSAVESGECVYLHSDKQRRSESMPVPQQVSLPGNLFIIGTVNVDETTYMFSPKVLDRANVMELRATASDIEAFMRAPARPDLSRIEGLGHGGGFGELMVNASLGDVFLADDQQALFEGEMLVFFNFLQLHGAEFGYRTVYEAQRFTHYFQLFSNCTEGSGGSFGDAFDCVVLQKMLPKLHGSQAQLSPILKGLWYLCANATDTRGDNPAMSANEASRSSDRNTEPTLPVPGGAPYPRAAEKIARMWRLLRENGFTSFAEA